MDSEKKIAFIGHCRSSGKSRLDLVTLQAILGAKGFTVVDGTQDGIMEYIEKDLSVVEIKSIPVQPELIVNPVHENIEPFWVNSRHKNNAPFTSKHGNKKRKKRK